MRRRLSSSRLLPRRGEVERMAVKGGFVEVKDDDVILLVTHAVKPEDIDKPAPAEGRVARSRLGPAAGAVDRVGEKLNPLGFSA